MLGVSFLHGCMTEALIKVLERLADPGAEKRWFMISSMVFRDGTTLWNLLPGDQIFVTSVKTERTRTQSG